MDQSWSIVIIVIIDQSTTFYQTTIASFQWTTINIVTFRQYFGINDEFIVSVSNGEKFRIATRRFSAFATSKSVSRIHIDVIDKSRSTVLSKSILVTRSNEFDERKLRRCTNSTVSIAITGLIQIVDRTV